MSDNGSLALMLAFMGAVFLIFALLFARKKENACNLIAGFNTMTEAQKAQYDRAAIARDHGKLFAWWTGGAFLFSGLTFFFGWIPFAAAWALLIASLVPHIHRRPGGAKRRPFPAY